MFKRPNLRRVLVFFVPSLLVVIIIHNLVLINYHKKDNLVSLFYVRQNNLTGELKAEIYPIALLYRGKYYDASINVGECVQVKAKRESYLATFKRFFIIGEGKQLGEFHVSEVTPSPFMCSNILTGKGNSEDNAALSDVFNLMRDSRSSHAKGFADKKEFDYSLKWTLAVTKIGRAPESAITTADKDIERYKADLINRNTALVCIRVRRRQRI